MGGQHTIPSCLDDPLSRIPPSSKSFPWSLQIQLIWLIKHHVLGIQLVGCLGRSFEQGSLLFIACFSSVLLEEWSTGPLMKSIPITWELVRHTDSQVPFQTHADVQSGAQNLYCYKLFRVFLLRLNFSPLLLSAVSLCLPSLLERVATTGA